LRQLGMDTLENLGRHARRVVMNKFHNLGHGCSLANSRQEASLCRLVNAIHDGVHVKLSDVAFNHFNAHTTSISISGNASMNDCP
jgi:hypothetical protein